MRFSLSKIHLTRAVGNRHSKIQIITHTIAINIFLSLLIHSRDPWNHFQTNPLTQGTMGWWHQWQQLGNTKSTKNWAPGSSFPFPRVQLLAGTGAYLALLFFSTCRKNFNGQWGNKPNTCWRLYYHRLSCSSWYQVLVRQWNQLQKYLFQIASHQTALMQLQIIWLCLIPSQQH